MALWLKQSTAKVVSFGPFLDKTDGVTEETGLVSALDHGTTGIKLSKNGGALTIRHATVTASTYDAYGMYRVTLDTTDTNTLGTLRMAFNEAATCLPVWQDFMVLPANIYDSIVSGSDLIDVSMTQILGTAVSSPATAGVLDVNLKNIANAAVSTSSAQLGVNVVNAGATAWGSGAITAGSIASDAITAAKIAAGAIDNATFAADVGSTAYATNIIALAADKAIANAALATAANLAAAKTVVDAVKVKTDYLPSATAGAAGGVFIAGSNAATSITTALTANITGNLSGSVGSVTGAVGSVTGAVGSVTGAVGSVTGAVGSVTGNVGGNVTGSVGSVAANGITSTSIATDAINAASVKADAVTKIQNGLATPTNITAGTITTTTNLTNLPAAAALEATLTAMKGATFSGATDSLEALRDRGDAAWATATGFSTLDAAGVRTAVGLATANLDTQLGDLPTAAENATALLDAANGVETGLTPREALRLTSAALAGKISGAETTTVVIRNTADTKDRITATVDVDGNRTAITTDLT